MKIDKKIESAIGELVLKNRSVPGNERPNTAGKHWVKSKKKAKRRVKK